MQDLARWQRALGQALKATSRGQSCLVKPNHGDWLTRGRVFTASGLGLLRMVVKDGVISELFGVMGVHFAVEEKMEGKFPLQLQARTY